MAPTPDELSSPGSVSYDSNTMTVGDGTWDFSKNTFLLPNLQGFNFDTMRYNGMGNRFSTLPQYHRIILAHGILGALIFLLLIPVSVMTARFYSKRPGFAVKYHSQINVVAGLLLLAVFMLGFFAVGPSRNLTNPHHGIGVAIFVLFILQLVGGRLVRHITKSRSLRIVIHQWSGRTIALLGIVQVPLGLTLYGSPKYTFILYALWMAFLLLVYFILSYRTEGRRELYMAGGRSEAGRTRVTDSEYFASEHKEHGSKWKWLGPLAAGAGLWAFMRRRKNKDEDDHRSRSRSRSVSRSRATEVISSRRGSHSYVDKGYSEAPTEHKSGGGFMKVLGGAAAAIGAGKLVSGFMNRRDRRRDEEYSAVSTETPRRHRPTRGAVTASEFSSDMTPDPRDETQTSLLPPSANPPAMAHAMGAADSRLGSHRPVTPRPSHARHRSGPGFEESDYSSYVSPSRRQPEEGRGGGIAKGIFAGLGMGWFAKKLADRRARKQDDRLQEEDDMRSGTQVSRFTGDGYPSPSRRDSRRPPVRRPTGFAPNVAASEMTESSLESRPAGGTYVPPSRPAQPGAVPPAVIPVPMPGGHSRSRSRHDVEPVAMPPMPNDPHGVLYSEGESSYRSGTRRGSSRRRRDEYGSPHSQPVSVKLKVHDDKDRNVTLRRLTEEEALAARGARGRADSESSLSGMESPSQGRRYRREANQRRAEVMAEGRAEEDRLAPLSPPNPAFAKGRRGKGGKDSAYYSGQPGPSGSTPMAGQTMSSLGSLASPESHGTWSAMSHSPSGPGDKPTESAAADNRRRRRIERRRGSSSRPAGTDMFD